MSATGTTHSNTFCIGYDACVFVGIVSGNRGVTRSSSHISSYSMGSSWTVIFVYMHSVVRLST